MFRILSIFLILISSLSSAQQPHLKGDLDAFIKNNIIYPPFSLHNCIQGTIKIGFKLNAEGEVYESSVSQGLGIDLDDEALRLVKMSSGQWIVPLSHDTTALLIVPVSFELKGYGCESKSKADMELSIQSYKNQEELFNVILNFYKSKEKGIYKKEDELRIQLIKNDLGIDDEFLERKLNAGLRKYKQGDKTGACEEFNFVKYMGSDKADDYILKYCR